MITATAVQRVRQGSEDRLIALMKDLTAKVKAGEPGCAFFQYLKTSAQDRTYLVIEQYIDEEAFTYHHNTDYLKSFIPQMMECLEQPPDVVVYHDVFQGVARNVCSEQRTSSESSESPNRA